MNNPRFDLDTAIAAWCRPFEVNPAFSAEDVEALESSLGDRKNLKCTAPSGYTTILLRGLACLVRLSLSSIRQAHTGC